MEISRANIESKSKINIINVFKKFLAQSRIQKIQDIYSKNEKYLYFFFSYAEKHMKVYLQNYNKNAYFIKRKKFIVFKKIFRKK